MIIYIIMEIIAYDSGSPLQAYASEERAEEALAELRLEHPEVPDSLIYYRIVPISLEGLR